MENNENAEKPEPNKKEEEEKPQTKEGEKKVEKPPLPKVVSRDAVAHHGKRRMSIDRGSVASDTLMAHALRDVISEHIMAGPRGALMRVQSHSSLGGDSRSSSHTIELHYLRRRTLEGEDVPVDFEDAIAETGHGCFQYKLMALCGFIYGCCSLSTTTLSFVLPAAQPDFDLKSLDKGILNTAPLWGMVVGAYMWGNFADSRGRKFVLFYSLLIDAFAAFLSSLCQNYTLFFICRIFNGFGIIGATSMVFAYLGEFIDYHKRDRYLSRLELFWTFGIISLPVIGIAILPRPWSLGDKKTFLYNSWRIFVFACGLPSLVAAILISRMPESPRFLLLQGHHDKTRHVLVHMFTNNTKLPPSMYPVKVLNMDPGDEAFYFPKLHGISRWKKVKKFLRGLYKQHRDLLRGRSLVNILLTCFIDFGLMSVYFTVMLWVPELLHREEQYERDNHDQPATICKAAKTHGVESGQVETSTFVHTFIICMACLPTNIMLLFVISYIGKKSLLGIKCKFAVREPLGSFDQKLDYFYLSKDRVTMSQACFLLFTALPTLGLHFMDSTFKVTTMLCVFEMFATLIETVLFCAIVEIFPMSTRGTALALTVTVGRFGAALGNVMFGLLIDNYCDYLFFTMSGILAASGVASLLLPKMSRGHQA